MISTQTKVVLPNFDRRNGKTVLSSTSSPIAEQLDYLECRHPGAHSLLDLDVVRDPERMADHCEHLGKIVGHAEFDEDKRGRAYRDRQMQVPLARETGDRKILGVLNTIPGGLTYRSVGTDLIGGNGTTARVAAKLMPARHCPYVISSDPCYDMVEDALAQNLPAVWQSAQSTLFDSGVLDFVVASRGFHHPDTAARPAIAIESHRILKKNGLVLYVDFEEGSPTAQWYRHGLHAFTETGHQFDHFTRDGFRELLTGAGFSDVSVFEIYDPFIFRAETPETARNRLLEHLVTMFGMVRLNQEVNESEADFWDRIDATLAPYSTFSSSDIAFDPEAVRRFSVFQESPGIWRAEFPRVALCASGVKK